MASRYTVRPEIGGDSHDSALERLLSEPLSLQEVVSLLQAAFPDTPQAQIKKGLSMRLIAQHLCGR